MRIPALALAQRTLLVVTRGHAPYLLRMLLVAFMLVAIWLTVRSSSRFGAPGLHLFHWLLYANFFFISLFGVSTFSGVVTEEKENRTLGLLKLAGFSPASLLVGKSIGQLLAMALQLLVQVPFALLAFTLGGVSRYQIAAAWLVLLGHLLFVYGLALLVSVVTPRSGLAARVTGLLLLGYYLLPLLGEWIANWSGSMLLLQLSTGLQKTQAWTALQATTVTGYRAPLFTPPLVVTLTLAAVLFALAGLLFTPCTRTETVPAPARRVFTDWVLGPRATLRSRRPALFWKDFLFAIGGPVGLLFRFACYGVVLVIIGLFTNRGYQGQEEFGLLTMQVMFLVLLFDLGTQAGRVFREEIKWRTLPLLMVLPVPLHHWGYAKVVACTAIALPAATGFALGAAMAPRTVGFLWRDALENGWYLLGHAVVALHLTVWLSLRLPRGAFAVTVLLLFLGHLLLSMMLWTMDGRVDIRNGVGVCLLGVAIMLHPAIARRLRQKAAE